MPRVIEIRSFADHPLLQPYATMRRSGEHREQGIFVAEGQQVVERLLASELRVQSLLVPRTWAEKLQGLIQERTEAEIHLFVAEKALLEKLTGYQLYQGVLAVAHTPAPATLEILFEPGRAPRLILAVDGVSSAENMGQLVRTAAAFGATGVVTSHTSCSVWLRRAVRTSMGAVFQTAVVEQVRLKEAIARMKAARMRVIAAHPHTSERTLPRASFKADCCVLVGSEGHGISPELLHLADERVAIPMPSGVDSLNVNAAAAVFLYEAFRQRNEG